MMWYIIGFLIMAFDFLFVDLMQYRRINKLENEIMTLRLEINKKWREKK